jgi:hypothetical protein
MFDVNSVLDSRPSSGVGSPAVRTRLISPTLNLPSATGLVCGGLVAAALWDYFGETPIEVFSALVQTGVPTRLVLLVLLFACGAGLFAFRTRNQIWYGHVVCVVAVAMAWDMIRRLAIEIQPADVLGLAASLYLLVQGLTEIQTGREPSSR